MLTFVNDFSLMHGFTSWDQKSKVFSIFNNFKALVKNHTNRKIKKLEFYETNLMCSTLSMELLDTRRL